MARITVEAVSRESKGSDSVWELELFVSASWAEDGSPVTGLEAKNFRFASSVGLVRDIDVASVHETEWEPGDTRPAGCYSVSLRQRNEGSTTPVNFVKGEFYMFGLQVRLPDREEKVMHQGQTVVRVQSLGT